MEQRMQKHLNFAQNTVLEEQRLVVEAQETRNTVNGLRFGPARDTILLKARRGETASYLTEWLNSPGLKPPT